MYINRIVFIIFLLSVIHPLIWSWALAHARFLKRNRAHISWYMVVQSDRCHVKRLFTYIVLITIIKFCITWFKLGGVLVSLYKKLRINLFVTSLTSNFEPVLCSHTPFFQIIDARAISKSAICAHTSASKLELVRISGFLFETHFCESVI